MASQQRWRMRALISCLLGLLLVGSVAASTVLVESISPQASLKLPDVEVSAGSLLHLPLLPNELESSVSNLRVSEASSGTLPSWLHLDTSSSVLQGVPTLSSVGQVYINVTADMREPSSDASHTVTDVFMIDVTPAAPAKRNTACFRFSGSVTLDHLWSQFQASHTVAVFSALALAAELPIQNISLTGIEPAAVAQTNQGLLSSLFGIGRTVVAEPRTSLFWEVKCQVFPSESAAQLVRDRLSSQPAELAGTKVLRWEMSTVLVNLPASDSTSTPQPTPEIVAVPAIVEAQASEHADASSEPASEASEVAPVFQYYRRRRDTSTNPLDLIFVVDGSGSIGLGGFTQLLTLALDIVKTLNIGQDEVRFVSLRSVFE